MKAIYGKDKQKATSHDVCDERINNVNLSRCSGVPSDALNASLEQCGKKIEQGVKTLVAPSIFGLQII
jgi:hypothetical protein